MNILVTGSTGFVGKALVNELINDHQFNVLSCSRRCIADINIDHIVVNSFTPDTNWGGIIDNQDVVVHLAGIAHQPDVGAAEMDLVNYKATLHLARCAAEAGVARFIFMSTIAVNGQISDAPFTELDQPNPDSAYALSKYNAEQALLELTKTTGLEVVIIRPPLVYGFGAPGNFGALVAAVKAHLPLPLGSVNNKRSIISVYNLVDFIIHCLRHPDAANQVFLISDDIDVSTPTLIKSVAATLGCLTLLLPIPDSVLSFIARVCGKEKTFQKLCGRLQIDSSKSKTRLGWLPPFTLQESLLKSLHDNMESKALEAKSLKNDQSI